ncbi:MAG TPA: 5,10-methylenetetrahydrofolate reductase [Peptococcaceae bacterium]|nr:5,10-methylenetetrahydrofolate reductase [Peptococcaceae bacterium]
MVSLKTDSRLEKLLKDGHFVVTAEIGPPKNADASIVKNKARMLKGFIDAANITDNQTAVVRLSSIASAVHVLDVEMEPVIQMTVRDRNRIGLQSDLLGAYSLGIKNVVCMSGDHQIIGNHPESKGVYDLDSIQLIQAVKNMRDKKEFINGELIQGTAPCFFIGAVASPFLQPEEMNLMRLEKKIRAGADFIQTQCIYDMKKFEKWMSQVRDMELSSQAYFLAGLMPLKSSKVARYMQDNIPGIGIPETIIRRMERAKEPAKEGIKLAVEQIHWLKTIEGVHGVHIMAVGWEEVVPEIVERAGLLPRP